MYATTSSERPAASSHLRSTAIDAERFALLTSAEGTIATSVTVPLLPPPAAYRTIIDAKRAQFAARRDEFAALRDSARQRVKDLLADFEARLRITPFDLTDLSTKEEIGQCVTFGEDVVRVVNVVAADAGRRIAAADALLAQHDAAAAETARSSILVSAAKALLGEAFLIVPANGR